MTSSVSFVGGGAVVCVCFFFEKPFTYLLHQSAYIGNHRQSKFVCEGGHERVHGTLDASQSCDLSDSSIAIRISTASHAGN